MRVLQIYKDFYPPVVGGIEGHINLLSTGLLELGIEVKVLVSNTTSKLQRCVIDGVAITKAPEFGRFASAPANITFPKILKEMSEGADILHFHLPNPTATISYLLSGISKPCVATYHSDIVKQVNLKKVYRPFQTKFLNKIDAIIATSPNYVRTSHVLRYYLHKCRIIPLGIDIDKYQKTHTILRNNITNKLNEPFILFIGKFRYYKGIHILIEAMERVNSKLIIVGDGQLKDELERKAKEKNLTSRVQFLGELDDIELKSCLHACSLLVLPSVFRSEAFGIVLLEAMACGKPVISTEIGTGTSYVNIHGKTGFVIPPNDPLKLSEAINYLLSNQDESKVLGKAGKNRVLKKFGSVRMVKETVDLYKEITSRNPDAKQKFYTISKHQIEDNVLEKKTSVLHIITRLIVGGAQENTLYTSELLDHRRYDIDVLCGIQTGSEGSLHERAKVRGIPIYLEKNLVREINPIKDILAFVGIIRYIRKKHFRLVHTHSSKAGIIGRWAAWVVGVPVIIHTVHGWGFHDYQNRVLRSLYIFAEKLTARITNRLIVVTNEDIKKGLAEGIGKSKDYNLIRSGIDLSSFANPNGNADKIRKNYGIPANAKVIGTVTRLSPQKAPHIFVQMSEIVCKIDPDVFFVIVGDGPIRKNLQKRIKKLGISQRVIFTGIRYDVDKLLQVFDVFVLTSLWEGLPRVIPQAMAAGVPVVASRVDGNAEIIQHNQNGILIKPGSAQDFADAVIRLTRDKKFAQRLSDAALNSIDDYSVETMVHQIEYLYKEIA